MKSVFEEGSRYRKITELLLLAFVAECSIGGSGRWLEIGPLSIRMILFALCFGATLPLVLYNLKALAKNPQIILTVLYGVYLALCAWIGLRGGNQPGFIWADISTMLTLALAPGFLVAMSGKNAINRAMNVVYWASVAVAAVTVVLHFLFAFIDQNAFALIYKFIVGRSLGGIAPLQTGLQRIYLRSQMFLQVAIIYGVWKLGKAKKPWLLHITNGLLLSACILSYTRGFWLGLVVSAVLLLCMGVKYWKGFFKTAAKMVAVFLVFVLVSSLCYRGPVVLVEVVNRLNPDLLTWQGEEPKQFTGGGKKGMDSEVSESDSAAVEIREQTLFYSRQRIRQSPILGNGLGENLDEIRDDGRTEYMYMDQVVKTGIIGAALFVLVYFSFVGVQCADGLSARRKGKKELSWEDPRLRNRFLTAAYLGIAVTSYFNPFLNNPMGIMLLLLTSTAVYSTEK